MSAWIVARRHIDFLVACLLASDGLADIRNSGGADAVGQELWRECHASVNYRYSNQPPETCPEYTYTPLTLPDLTTRNGLIYASNAVASYHYQSSQHPGWEGSRAQAWIQRLQEGLRSALDSRGGDSEAFHGINGWRVVADYQPSDALIGEDNVTASPMVTVSLTVVNTYEGSSGEHVRRFTDQRIPAPPAEDDSEAYQRWAFNHLYVPYSGTGRAAGNSGADVEITASSDPTLVGRTFRWG